MFIIFQNTVSDDMETWQTFSNNYSKMMLSKHYTGWDQILGKQKVKNFQVDFHITTVCRLKQTWGLVI